MNHRLTCRGSFRTGNGTPDDLDSHPSRVLLPRCSGRVSKRGGDLVNALLAVSELSDRIEAILRARYPDGLMTYGAHGAVALEGGVTSEWVRKILSGSGWRPLCEPLTPASAANVARPAQRRRSTATPVAS